MYCLLMFVFIVSKLGAVSGCNSEYSHLRKFFQKGRLLRLANFLDLLVDHVLSRVIRQACYLLQPITVTSIYD
jgi:hypothetical protein